MDSKTLRLLWGVISENSPETLNHLSDDALVSSLLNQISRRTRLSATDHTDIESYLSIRGPLIRNVL